MSRERSPQDVDVGQAVTVVSGPPDDASGGPNREAREAREAGDAASRDAHGEASTDAPASELEQPSDSERRAASARRRAAYAGATQDFDPAAPEPEPEPGDEPEPPHRAVTVLARPGAAAPGEAPPVEAQLAHSDTLSERGELAQPPRAARGSASPVGGPRYQARGEIGRGGMGRVLEALDRRLDRVVAIKESFATDDDGRQRFEREVAITARLEHPSIVPLYDSGITADGRAYYVMRKLSGRGLDLVMAELKSLDERLALLPALLAACDAVAHAHARRVVHRDIKPGNILIGDHGETMVIDWGLAKAIGDSVPPARAATAPADPATSAPSSPADRVTDNGRAGGRVGTDRKRDERDRPASGSAARKAERADPSEPLSPLAIVAAAIPGSGSRPVLAVPVPPDDLKTIVGSVFGTPGFMSPEQARGEQLDMRGDVYALGATLYHLLAGRPPHVGRSATEVIDRVRVEPPPPLGQVCPGAPVELAAIVEQAMAFDIDERYPEAGDLAGDLRRFLAGQLVAAHRYTAWQKLRRAARAHRAAFLVAGASLLVVSALAAVSILRIISERDTARQAREIAVQETLVAKAARDVAAARADELVVAQAQGLVEQNPTAALGLLKRLPATSLMWPRARMVAMGALAEGVTRAVPYGAARAPSIFSLSPRGDRLLVGDEEGQVWTLEMESLRRRDVVDAGARPVGCWIDNGNSVVLASASLGLVIRDLDSGRSRAVPITSPVSQLGCHPTGVVAFIDSDGALWLLDPTLAQTRKIETGVVAEDLELTPDGAWIALGSDREAVILDRDGAVRRRFAGEVIRIISSAGSRLGIMFRDRAIELDPALALAAAAAPPPATAKGMRPAIALSLAPRPPRPPADPSANDAAILEYPMSLGIFSIYFVGERLRLLKGGTRLIRGDGNIDVDLPANPMGFTALGDRTTALGLNDGSVWLTGWWGSRFMRTPATSPIHRLAGRPGSAHVAGWSRGNVLVWNLGGAIPRSLPVDVSVGRLLFLGDDRLTAIGMKSWYWMDLGSSQTYQLEQVNDLPLFNTTIVDVDRGDALLLDTMMGRALLMRWANKAVLGPWNDKVSSAALLGEGAIAIGTTDGRLAVGMPGAALKLLEMDSPIIGVTRLGEHGVVAIDAEGELLSYDLPSGTVVKSSLGEPPNGAIVDDGVGGVIIALGARLVRWDPSGVQELVRIGEPVGKLTRYQHHLAILTASELSTMDLRGPPVVRRIASGTRNLQIAEGSRWGVGIGPRGLIDLIDIATGVRWSKSIHGGVERFAASPGGTRVAQLLRDEIALWTYAVPEAPAALRAWLDETTNATVGESLDVVWSAPGS